MIERNWAPEFRRTMDSLDELTPGNRRVLVYQFDLAREKHPEGFMMDVYGHLIYPAKGYAVGMTPQSETTVEDAIDTLARIQKETGFRNLYLGYWHDDQDGVDYIDVSMVTDSWPTAEVLGRTMRQKAVWDFSTDSAIRLDYDMAAGGHDMVEVA